MGAEEVINILIVKPVIPNKAHIKYQYHCLMLLAGILQGRVEMVPITHDKYVHVKCLHSLPMHLVESNFSMAEFQLALLIFHKWFTTQMHKRASSNNRILTCDQ